MLTGEINCLRGKLIAYGGNHLLTGEIICLRGKSSPILDGGNCNFWEIMLGEQLIFGLDRGGGAHFMMGGLSFLDLLV